MRLKFSLRQKLLAIIVAELVIALALVLFSYFSSGNSADSSSATPTEIVIIPPPVSLSASESVFGLPVRLKIPVINVDASIEAVGLTPGGAMDVPKNPDGVGWFDLGPHPGNIGSAVIAGHYGIWKNGQETVFDNLNKLQSGDKINVLDDQGTSISFVVRESLSFDPNADASSVFVSDDGKSHLNLITCEGTWDAASKSYSKRLVVFADKE